MEFKFVLALLLTPLLNPIVGLIGPEDEDEIDRLKIAIQFYLVCFFLLFSISLKSYREDFCNSFEPNPYADALAKIKSKLEQQPPLPQSTQPDIDPKKKKRFAQALKDLNEVYGKEVPNKFDEPTSQKKKANVQEDEDAPEEYNYLVKGDLRKIKRDFDDSSDFDEN